MFKLVKNNFGVGLVEVLLASGIGLVVTMGIFRVSTTAVKTTQTTQTILAEESLSKVVRESLGNEADCKWNLSPTRLVGSAPLTGQSIPALVKNGDITNQAVTLIKAKSTTESGGFPEDNPLLLIKKLELKQVHSSDSDQREFTVYYEKKGLGRFSTRENRACTSTNLSGCYKLSCKMSYKNPFLPDTNPESTNNCKLLDCVASEDVLRGQACPEGQYLQGFGEFEELTCATLPTPCPDGEVLTGFNADGTAGACASVLSSSDDSCSSGQIPIGLDATGNIECDAICGSGKRWSEICKKCYKHPPSSGKTWSHAECDFVCSSPNPTCSGNSAQKWNESTCACVNKCAPGETHDPICEGKEQDPKPQFCYAPCVAGEHWSPDACSCVSNCPEGVDWVAAPCNRCKPTCSSGTIWSSSSCRCIDNCPSSIWLATCNRCRPTCPDGTTWQTSSCRCVGNCPSSSWVSRCQMCKPTCPSGTTWSSSSCRCLNNCPSGAWVSRCNRCRPTCARGYEWSSSLCRCKSRCRGGSWKWDSNCNRCKSSCPSGQYWSSSRCRCKSRCGSGGTWNSACNKCQYRCSPSKSWNASRCRCESKCSTGTWSTRCNKCKTPCPVGKKWSWSRCSCVDSCPNSEWSQRCRQCIPTALTGYKRWDNTRCEVKCTAPQSEKTACNNKPRKTLNRVIYTTGVWANYGTLIATYSWDNTRCECKETIANICRDLRDHPYRYPHIPYNSAVFRRTGTTCLKCNNICTQKQKLQHECRSVCGLTRAQVNKLVEIAHNHARNQCRPDDWDRGSYQCVNRCPPADQHWNGRNCVTCSSTQRWSSNCRRCYSCSDGRIWNRSTCRCGLSARERCEQQQGGTWDGSGCRGYYK